MLEIVELEACIFRATAYVQGELNPDAWAICFQPSAVCGLSIVLNAGSVFASDPILNVHVSPLFSLHCLGRQVLARHTAEKAARRLAWFASGCPSLWLAG